MLVVRLCISGANTAGIAALHKASGVFQDALHGHSCGCCQDKPKLSMYACFVQCAGDQLRANRQSSDYADSYDKVLKLAYRDGIHMHERAFHTECSSQSYSIGHNWPPLLASFPIQCSLHSQHIATDCQRLQTPGSPRGGRGGGGGGGGKGCVGMNAMSPQQSRQEQLVVVRHHVI